MKKSANSCENSQCFFLYFVLLSLISGTILAQGPTSSIGDRENLGLFGGPANDLSISFSNHRIFAAGHSPSTLFFSDDSAATWQQAFSFDSLEYDFGNRGWGGGAFQVLTNQSGWVAALTGFSSFQLSASVVSYNNGNSFQTAVDPFLINRLVSEPHQLSALNAIAESW
jgi:hypothetical protein